MPLPCWGNAVLPMRRSMQTEMLGSYWINNKGSPLKEVSQVLCVTPHRCLQPLYTGKAAAAQGFARTTFTLLVVRPQTPWVLYQI